MIWVDISWSGLICPLSPAGSAWPRLTGLHSLAIVGEEVPEHPSEHGAGEGHETGEGKGGWCRGKPGTGGKSGGDGALRRPELSPDIAKKKPSSVELVDETAVDWVKKRGEKLSSAKQSSKLSSQQRPKQPAENTDVFEEAGEVPREARSLASVLSTRPDPRLSWNPLIPRPNPGNSTKIACFGVLCRTCPLQGTQRGSLAPDFSMRPALYSLAYAMVPIPRPASRGDFYCRVPTPGCLLQGLLHVGAPIQRYLRRGAYSKVCFAWGPLLRGTYSKVVAPRRLLQGYPLRGTYSEVLTQRCLLRGAYSEVPTPRCLLRGTHSEVPTPKVPTPRSLLQGYPLRGAYSEVPT